MTSIDDVLRETISKLSLDTNLKTEDFTYLIGEFARIIEYRKNQEFYYNNQQMNEVSNTFSDNTTEPGFEKADENKKESAIIETSPEKTSQNNEEPSTTESPTTVTAKPSFKEILKKDGSNSNIDTSSNVVSSNSVTSTNSSRNSGQQHSIAGIGIFDEEIIEKMKHNPEMNKNIEEITIKNKKIYNIDTLIKSLLDAGIPMWKIMFYFYISNKEFDISSSTSSEDARQNDKKFQILEDYSKNKLINFDDTHPFYEYIEYYFDKTIDYNSKNDYFISKKDKSGNPIVLIFKNRFVKLINKSMTRN